MKRGRIPAASRAHHKARLLPVQRKRVRSTTLFLVIACVVLVGAILAVYAQTFHYDFVAYDDDQFVYQNPMVTGGLSAAGVAWAFTSFYAANWHPLTWLSYQTDFQLFGLNAGAGHAVNVALHIASTLLLFLALFYMTKQPWRCALVAGIFALHPLHVESVAWIAERKDVLGTFFSMLMLLFYILYVRAPSVARYVAVALAFALALASKPMVVTWPFILVLLDFWPLRRLHWPLNPRALGRVLWEKAPLFAMSAVASVLTYLAQKSGGAVASLEHLPLSARFANALAAYLMYMEKAIWPTNLAAFYPPQTHDIGILIAAVVVLLGITLIAVLRARQSPWILVGWLWYLGMLVPVIGIVQVGRQSMADRYVYVPLVALSIAVVWTVADLIRRSTLLQQAATAISVGVIAVLAIVAWHQTGYWQNSHTLFEHALAVTHDNYVMESNMGIVLGQEGRRVEAEACYRRAIAIQPDYADAYANLGRLFLVSGQTADAMPALLQAVHWDPNLEAAQADLGVLLAAEGKFPQAEPHLEQAARLQPSDAETQSNLCSVLQYLARPAEAVARCREALRLKPDSPPARLNLAGALAALGRRAEAVQELTTVLQQHPDYSAARAALDDLQRAP